MVAKLLQVIYFQLEIINFSLFVVAPTNFCSNPLLIPAKTQVTRLIESLIIYTRLALVLGPSNKATGVT